LRGLRPDANVAGGINAQRFFAVCLNQKIVIVRGPEEIAACRASVTVKIPGHVEFLLGFSQNFSFGQPRGIEYILAGCGRQ